MNKEVKKEQYRNLSIAALVSGLLTVSLVGFCGVIVLIAYLMDELVLVFATLGIIYIIMPPLLITAIVCGSIDLIRIKTRSYSNKGRGFDISGIVMGGIIILALVALIVSTIVTY